MNVVEPILFQAKHDPPAPAMCAPGTAMGVVSYARLARFIHNVGRRAISAGISPGDVVILQVKDHIFHTSLTLGLMYIGVATVSLSGALPGHLPCDFIITDTPRSYANGKNAKILAADFAWISGDGIPVDERHVYRGAGNDICRIALTSGSIGEPKVVGFTHNNQLARLARYNHLFGRIFPECSRFFSDYGFGSSGGFRHILYVLSRGGTMFFPGASPMDTLQTFELCKVQGLIASPGGLSGFLKFYDANPAFRSGFEVIIAAGSPLHSSLSERVRARLCSNLISYYGTTETSTVSSALAHALTGIVGAVGHVAPDVSVRALSKAGAPLPSGHEGVVLVRTPVSVTGYLDTSGQSETVFRDGHFDTGDIGYLTQDRMLVITGRKKEVLNLGGDKVSPQLIEDAVAAFRGIREVGAFSMANDVGVEEVWSFIVHGDALDTDALHKHCRERLSQTHVPVRFISVPSLPRNANGKLQRQRLPAMAQELRGAGQ